MYLDVNNKKQTKNYPLFIPLGVMEKMFFHVSCKWKVENSDDLYEYTKILLACFIKEGRGAVKQSEPVAQNYGV